MKNITEKIKAFYGKLKQGQKIGKILLFLVPSITIILLLPSSSKFKYEYSKKGVWNYQDLYAPFDFPILKSEQQIEDEKKQIIQKNRRYFTFDNMATEQNMLKILNLDKSTISDKNVDSLRIFLMPVISDFLKEGVIPSNTSEIGENGRERVFVVKNSIEENKLFSNLVTFDNFKKRVYNKVRKKFSNQTAEQIEHFLSENFSPNLIFNVELTSRAANSKIENISDHYGLVTQGKRIISKDEPINETQFVILNSLAKAYQTDNDNLFLKEYSTILGHGILIFLLFYLLFFYIKHIKKGKIYKDRNLMVIMFNVMLSFFMCLAASKISPKLIFIVPMCLQVLVLRSFYGARIALFTQIVTIFICSFLAPSFSMFIFTNFLMAMICSLSFNISQRSLVFINVLKLTITGILSAAAFSLIQEGDMSRQSLLILLYLAVAGVLTLFSLPILYMYEKLFSLTSDVALLEFSNTSANLLTKLSEKASGTMQHSLSVANLAEALAKELGANALLARVGGLYHDIGKMDNPNFFIENQSGKNPHDQKTAKESVDIILSHVYKGIEISKKEALPKAIMRFIRTHHGTSLVYYFYAKAKREAEEKGYSINESDFRYPFQKPLTKEEAILMMCDSVEAASRSLKEYTEENIFNLIDKIIELQIKDGQFNDADITYKEISKAREFLKKRFLSIYHSRISYDKKE